MTDDQRPDPDLILRQLKADEVRQSSGQLRVFLGMSAGVGKTYAMLRAAHARLKEGCNVVVGIVETHGRVETLAMTENLPLIARKKIDYKGVILEEMDLDAILAVKPALVLVDELAHSNVPGSRHAKRYQDVIELLDNGIDVYTTINVQHLESRKDLVEKITSVPIRETVPDSVLERASQIEVIDITPDELLKRLKEGKVYLGEKANRAAENFFKQDSLTALREIALRFTAEKVDHELQAYHALKHAVAPWQTNERLMVAISHSPYSEPLIRATRRLAYNLEAPWIAIHVDDGKKLNTADEEQLAKNLQLARELKAEVVTTTDTDITSALRRIARQKNVTQIVVGRPTRKIFSDFIAGGSLLERLVRESGEVDVHVIRQENYRPNGPWFPKTGFRTGPIAYWNTFVFLMGVGFISGMLEPIIGYRAVGFLFLLAVLVVGRMGTLGPVVLGATISALVWNFFFIPPKLTFAISTPEDFILCATFFVVAVITGTLTTRVRTHEMLLREREERTNVLYAVLKDISSSRGKAEFLSRVTTRMSHVFSGECGVLLKERDGKLTMAKDDSYQMPLAEKEFAVAQWSFENGKMAGWSTETLAQSGALFVPLKGNAEPVGVFIYKPKDRRKLSLEQQNLLLSVCGQLGLSIERHFVDNRLLETSRLQESEKLHQTLLNTISHEMRTPLTSILGSAYLLQADDSPNTEAFRKTIGAELTNSGERLNRVIENLLDMSRLNAGVMAIKKEWHDIHDLIGVTVKRLGAGLNDRKLTIDFPPVLPLVEMDFRLVEHALENVIFNAASYTPVGSEIRVSADVSQGFLSLIVEDSGAGIPVDSLDKIFDKFYRVPGTPAGGTGLGLSIVKSIAEFHHGGVRVENRREGGARFVISLPLGVPPSMPQEIDD